jgi:ketosteroid isomerase-like protein
MRRLALVIPSLALLAGCQPGAAPLSDEDIGSLAGLRAAYIEAVLANDCEAETATTAEDIVFMPANEPMVEGRAAFTDLCETGVSQGPPQDFTITSLVIDGYGDLAVDRGAWSETLMPEGAEPVTVTGKYVVIARKQADDSWLWTALIYNYDAPLPESPEQG